MTKLASNAGIYTNGHFPNSNVTEGNQACDLGIGGYCTGNSISQTLPTTAGGMYRLTFDWGSEYGWGTYARVTVGNLEEYLLDGDRRPNTSSGCITSNSATWILYSASFQFIASGDDVLTFKDLSNQSPAGGCTGLAGFALDNVRVEAVSDQDGDGLSDVYEAAIGTDPLDPDTDHDDVLDGEEVLLAEGTGCPNPLSADSDGDTLPDGYELHVLNTNPCDADSDADGVPDQLDPAPMETGDFGSVMEQVSRMLAESITLIDPQDFDAPNDKSAKGRRTSLANRCTDAANALAEGDITAALDSYDSLLKKIDGDSSPPDWLLDGTATKPELYVQVALIIETLLAGQV